MVNAVQLRPLGVRQILLLHGLSGAQWQLHARLSQQVVSQVAEQEQLLPSP